MAKMNFGGVEENVVTREEFPVVKALEALRGETIAVLGYGVQGPGQACNLRDNGFHVIVGQRPGKTYEKAVADGWVPGETLFSLEEAAERGTVICMLLSDAAQIQCWPQIKPHLTAGKTLYFSHGFAITWSDRTGIVPPKDIDVILVAPKGSGTSLRTLFVEGRGINSSYAVYQDVSGRALDKTLAIGIGIGIGGQMDVAAKISREVISTRKWNDSNSDALLNRMETELKDNINALGLGAAGTGGDTVCLAVKIGKAATHTAIAPVAINFHCWVARRAGIRLHDSGKVERIL